VSASAQVDGSDAKMRNYQPLLLVAAVFPVSLLWRILRPRTLAAVQIGLALLCSAAAVTGLSRPYPCLLLTIAYLAAAARTLRTIRPFESAP
jgi:hypothetical protein